MDRRVEEAAERLAEMIAGCRCSDGFPIDVTTGEPATWDGATASGARANRARITRDALLALVAAIARSEPAPHGVEAAVAAVLHAYLDEEARHIAAGNAWAALVARRWAEWWASKAEEVRGG